LSRRSRIFSFGSAALLVLAGTLCAIFVAGLTGQVLAISLITVGLGAAVLLVFYEVGLSEERELAREDERRRRTEEKGREARPTRSWRRPRRPG
jgi:hypothetical protein